MRGLRSVAAALLAGLILATPLGGCSEQDPSPGADPAAVGDPGAVIDPGAELARLDGPRLGGGDADTPFEVSASRPVFVHNVYLSASVDPAEQVGNVLALWPDDLEQYLAVQFVLPGQPPEPSEVTVPWLDAALAATDEAELPALVQVAVLGLRNGPDPAAIDQLVADHRSFAGLGVAEFSAPFDAAVNGLGQPQRDLLVELIEAAAESGLYFLWQEMGYFGPQVFVQAGADRALFDAIVEHRDLMLFQVKRNGSAKRFVTDAAVMGLWLTDSIGNWGVNSEDWLWWEAGFGRRFAPQVTGPLGVAGYPRDPEPTKARLSYPDSLYGTELLMAAAHGATVFSFEAPSHALGSTETAEVSPAATEVIFPTIRRIVNQRLIVDRAAVAARTPVAISSDDPVEPSFNYDSVFVGSYGPDDCGDDLASCSRRSWLPSTNRYGIVPILPALHDPDAEGGAAFESILGAEVLADPARVLAALDAAHPGDTPAVNHRAGGAWIASLAGTDGGEDGGAVEGAVGSRLLVANPNENSDVAVTAELRVMLGDSEVPLELVVPAHGFVIVSVSADSIDLWWNNFRTRESWWAPEVAEADAVDVYLADSVPDDPDRISVRTLGTTDVELVAEVDGEEVELPVELDLRGSTTVSLRTRA